MTVGGGVAGGGVGMTWGRGGSVPWGCPFWRLIFGGLRNPCADSSCPCGSITGSMMTLIPGAANRPWEAPASVPDHRRSAGRRYPLASLLLVAEAAMLSGRRAPLGIVRWGGGCAAAPWPRPSARMMRLAEAVGSGLLVTARGQARPTRGAAASEEPDDRCEVAADYRRAIGAPRRRASVINSTTPKPSSHAVSGSGVAVGSKLYVVLVPLTPIVSPSTYPLN